MAEDLSNGLRAAIEQAWDAGDAGAAATEAPATETADTSTEAPSEGSSDGRVRDENGRFTKKDGEQAAPPPAPEEDDYEDDLGIERDMWGKLAPEYRQPYKTQAQQRREAQQRLKGYEPIDQALAPVRDAWTMAYGSTDRALQQLIAIERVARENPTEFLRQFAQQRGLRPEQIFGQQQGQQQPPQQQDPMEVLRAEIRRGLQEEMQQTQVMTSVQAFEADASLEHRQNPSVRAAMAGLLQSGAAPDLKTAYDMACHADPSIRAKLQEAQAAQRAKQEQEQAAQRASERQNAAVSTTGSPGTARAPAGDTSPQSIRDIAAQAWDRQASARV